MYILVKAACIFIVLFKRGYIDRDEIWLKIYMLAAQGYTQAYQSFSTIIKNDDVYR